MNKFIMILNDGETWTNADGCRIAIIDTALIEAGDVDLSQAQTQLLLVEEQGVILLTRPVARLAPLGKAING